MIEYLDENFELRILDGENECAPESWILIPEGATFATGKNGTIFRKDGFYYCDDEINLPYWRSTDVTMENVGRRSSLDLVWVRDEIKKLKEWLLKTDEGKYYFHRDDMDFHPHYVEKIEIPKIADIAFLNGIGNLCFTTSDWMTEIIHGNIKKRLVKLSSHYQKNVVWQRKDDSVVDAEFFENDKVNQPNHYTSSSIECIDAMQSMLSREEFIGYLRGNIFKYQWRYKLKNGVEDLKKAQWYQNKLIEVEENE